MSDGWRCIQPGCWELAYQGGRWRVVQRTDRRWVLSGPRVEAALSAGGRTNRFRSLAEAIRVCNVAVDLYSEQHIDGP